ncbi:MAG: zinc ribbon domain-containing protein [Lachnospiraceae bacterium]|nr:zinc ribbon domain-containing protein [Lachnospiraceae bacterium]
MNPNLIGLIIVLVLLLTLAIVCFYAYKKIKQKIRSFSKMLFGTTDIRSGINRAEMQYAATPKSVAAATSLCLPRITRDFPDFHYDEMKERAENVLISYLRAVDSQNKDLLYEGTQELKDKLAMQISMMKSQGVRAHYEQIKVHRTEIHQYRKDKGRCSIIFQSAVEYLHYAEQNGTVISGRKQMKTQSKYNIQMNYIQDREIVEDTREQALGLNCPNCGAPLSTLGAKICAYCDSPLVEFNIKTWTFSDVEEVK